MRNNKFLIIFWIAFYLTIFSVLIHNSFSYLDPDLGWHLKVGENIYGEKAAPNLEHYNYTLEGQTWVDHEWLSNLIIYLLYTKLGYWSSHILFAAIIVLTLAILNILIQKYLIKEGGVSFYLAIFQMLGVMASLPHFGIRVQEISVLNVALLLLVIEHYNKNKNIKILFFLPLLFYLWASLHGGFLMGIFIMFFWLAVKGGETILKKFKYFSSINYQNKLTLKQLCAFFCFALGGVAATLATPYGFKLYQFLNYYKNDFYLKRIAEWLPFYSLPLNYWQLLYESLLITVILLILFYLWQRREGYKINPWYFSLSILFLILALKSKRHFPLLFIISLPLFIGFFVSFVNISTVSFLNKKWTKYLIIVKIYLIAGLIIISLAKVLNTNFISNPFIYFKESYPVAAASFLKSHPEYNNLKLFNNYDWGGYLIWVMPERKLFIDGRLPMLPFAGHTFLEEYLEFFKKEKMAEKLNQYNIGLVLLRSQEKRIKLNWFEKYCLLLNEEKINKRENHLKNYLENSAAWQSAYTDNVSKIYVKKIPRLWGEVF